MSIKNIIIVGLGAVGTAYAVKLKQKSNLKILADEKRIQKYKNNPRIFNNAPIKFEYLTEKDTFDADLIIIATKFNELENVISLIKNFVNENTIILPLINGVRSERVLSKYYSNVINSYYVGHSMIRTDNRINYDGIGKIVFGADECYKNECVALSRFFEANGIDYEYSNNIIYKKWIKLGVNIVLNQLSAIYNLTVGEVKASEFYKSSVSELLSEVRLVGEKSTGMNFGNYEQNVLDEINLIADDGITSMLQDIKAKKKTEVEIFSGEIINLAQGYNIEVPLNKMLYNNIKQIEENF